MLDRFDRYSDYPPGYADYEEERPNLLKRVGAIIAHYPIRTAAALVLTIGPAVIIANAVFFQHGTHPSPFFATRPSGEADIRAGIPIPRSRESARVVEVAGVEPEPLPVTPTSVSAIEVQEGLRAAGYYQGAVDGVIGSRTRAAIIAFQKEHQLEATGEVTPDLMAMLSQSQPAAAASPGVSPDITAAIDAESDRLKAVQTALNQIGYGPVSVSGKLGTDTTEAIQRFQLDNGLSITGEADESLVAKMVAIGAMEPI